MILNNDGSLHLNMKKQIDRSIKSTSKINIKYKLKNPSMNLYERSFRYNIERRRLAHAMNVLNKLALSTPNQVFFPWLVSLSDTKRSGASSLSSISYNSPFIATIKRHIAKYRRKWANKTALNGLKN